MNAREPPGCGEREFDRDRGAPIATLRPEPLVAECRHQFEPHAGDDAGLRAARLWSIGESVPRQRRDNEIERINRIASIGRRLGESRCDLEHLDDRPRPAVRDDERQRRRPHATNVQRVNA